MQQGRVQTAGKVEEYIGAQSVTVLHRRCGNRHKANSFVACVRRETGLPHFHWEEERSNGHCRFFVDRFCDEAGFKRICEVAEKHKRMLE